jgi:hypothetical protein
VFVLDGVLTGAGDQDYLALAGLVARFVTLTLRARSSQWLVTGAVRR